MATEENTCLSTGGCRHYVVNREDVLDGKNSRGMQLKGRTNVLIMSMSHICNLVVGYGWTAASGGACCVRQCLAAILHQVQEKTGTLICHMTQR